jgi:hypothetical protein
MIYAKCYRIPGILSRRQGKSAQKQVSPFAPRKKATFAERKATKIVPPVTIIDREKMMRDLRGRIVYYVERDC